MKVLGRGPIAPPPPKTISDFCSPKTNMFIFARELENDDEYCLRVKSLRGIDKVC